jgi:hypothetical protein
MNEHHYGSHLIKLKLSERLTALVDWKSSRPLAGGFQ